jgi:hypothetical protein
VQRRRHMSTPRVIPTNRDEPMRNGGGRSLLPCSPTSSAPRRIHLVPSNPHRAECPVSIPRRTSHPPQTRSDAPSCG